jgi:hypothetical protein
MDVSRLVAFGPGTGGDGTQLRSDGGTLLTLAQPVKSVLNVSRNAAARDLMDLSFDVFHVLLALQRGLGVGLQLLNALVHSLELGGQTVSLIDNVVVVSDAQNEERTEYEGDEDLDPRGDDPV